MSRTVVSAAVPVDRSRRSLGRALLTLGGWFVGGFLAGLLALLALPLPFGWRPMTEMSDSMRPLLRAGDIVVVAPLAPTRARVGDVVAFSDPLGSGRTITHRVLSVRISGDRVRFVTRGDANSSVERWSVATDGRVGRVVFRLPRLGALLAPLGTRSGRLLLVALPLALLCLLELWRIWRPAATAEG